MPRIRKLRNYQSCETPHIRAEARESTTIYEKTLIQIGSYKFVFVRAFVAAAGCAFLWSQTGGGVKFCGVVSGKAVVEHKALPLFEGFLSAYCSRV